MLDNKKVFKIWRTILPFVYVFVLVHFLKDIAYDILKMSTPLDLLGDVKEDLSAFPVFIRSLFVFLGIGSFLAEGFLLISIPLVIKKKQVSILEKSIGMILVALFLYFLAAILLDPRFRIG